MSKIFCNFAIESFQLQVRAVGH